MIEPMCWNIKDMEINCATKYLIMRFKEVSTQKDKSILFLTGSPASGKGHALKDEKISADINLNGHSIIYDNPMSDFGWGIELY
jgi:hypothetical protein